MVLDCCLCRYTFAMHVSPWHYVISRARPVIMQHFKLIRGHYFSISVDCRESSVHYRYKVNVPFFAH